MGGGGWGEGLRPLIMRCISIICIPGLAGQQNLVKTTQSDSKAGKYDIYTVCTYTVKGFRRVY